MFGVYVLAIQKIFHTFYKSIKLKGERVICNYTHGVVTLCRISIANSDGDIKTIKSLQNLVGDEKSPLNLDQVVV